MTITDDGTLSADATEVTTAGGLWQFVKKTDYDKSESARLEALAALKLAIEQAQAVHDDVETTTAARTALGTQLVSAKALVATAESFLGATVRAETMLNSAESLRSAMELCEALTTPYRAAMHDIDNVDLLGSSLSVKTITGTARTAVNAALGEKSIELALTTMRASAIAYLRSAGDLEDGLDITGIIANPSFETATAGGWYSTSGDVDAETTAPVAVADDMEGFDGDYYLESNKEGLIKTGQFVFQPVIGLPVGKYVLSAMMAVNPGTLRTNSGHVVAVVVPASILASLGDTSAENILANITTILRDGDVKSGSVKNSSSEMNIFEQATTPFEITDGAVVLIGFNGGLTAVTGAVPYRVDDVRLTVSNPVTAIDAIVAPATTAAPAYNLQGLPVDDTYRGIVITNGRKQLRR